jgi:hypothetical protein
MALHIEPARALVWYATYAWDAQLNDAARAAALAKAHLADRFVSVTRDATAPTWAALRRTGREPPTWPDGDGRVRGIMDRAEIKAGRCFSLQKPTSNCRRDRPFFQVMASVDHPTCL